MWEYSTVEEWDNAIASATGEEKERLTNRSEKWDSRNCNNGLAVYCAHYKDTDQFIIFINGFALNRNSCSYDIAYQLAKANGQISFAVTVYHDAKKPIPYTVDYEVA